MINENSIHAVNAARFHGRGGEHFTAPLYHSYCFSNLPGAFKHALGLESRTRLPDDVLGGLPTQYDKVIFLYIDAFGWNAFERARDNSPFLQRFVTEGVVSKLTSQFPSTTTAHVTTLYNDAPVGMHGVYEWFYYEPLLDRVICPLMYAFAGDEQPGTLVPTGVAPPQILPTRTLHMDLQAVGVNSYVFQHEGLSESPYAMMANAGATKSISFKTFPEACTLLANAVTHSREKALYFLYWDAVDTIGHDYGPSSVHYAAELDACLTTLERVLMKQMDPPPGSTLLLVSTDHGQVDVGLDTNFYLNVALPEIVPLVATNRDGLPLAPAGSPRDFFLHVKPGCADEAADILSQRLDGFADIRRTEDLIDAGFFGPDVSATFRARVSDLVILPYGGNTVAWYEEGRFEMKHRGQHGGLHQHEMEIPLLALALD